MISATPPRSPRRVSVRRHVRTRKRHVFWLAISLVLIMLLGWTVWFSGLFIVETLDILGPESYRAIVFELIVDDVLGRNIFFIDETALRERIGKAVPEIRDVHVNTGLFHNVGVQFQERLALGVWCRAWSSAKNCYFYDRDGVVWGEAVPSRGTLLVTVMDERPEGDAHKILIDEITFLIEGLKELRMSTTSVTLPRGSLNEVHLVTAEGYTVQFARQTSLAEQLETLGIFLVDMRASGASFEPSYIDARIPGKIYYQ